MMDWCHSKVTVQQRFPILPFVITLGILHSCLYISCSHLEKGYQCGLASAAAWSKEGFWNTLNMEIAIYMVSNGKSHHNTTLVPEIQYICHYFKVPFLHTTTARTSLLSVWHAVYILKVSRELCYSLKEGANRAAGKQRISCVLQFSMRW